jgi:dynactin complex subunit
MVSLCLLFSPLSAESTPGGEASPLEENLKKLNDLLLTIESDTNSQLKTIDDLETTISDSALLLEEQGKMLAESARLQAEMQAISERQSNLLRQSLRKSKLLTVSLTVAVPLTAVLTGILVWSVK